MHTYRNPIYNEDNTIDCEIEHPEFGWIDTTLNPTDHETSALYSHVVTEGSIAPFVAHVPTLEEVIYTLKQAVVVNLATLVTSYDFDTPLNYAKYIGYPNPFRAISEALGAHEASVWAYCEVELLKLKNNERAAPTEAQFINELPFWIAPI
jgi:hypothetical protein